MYSKQALYAHNLEGSEDFKLTKAFRCAAVKTSLLQYRKAACYGLVLLQETKWQYIKL
jgi:hypothetical protein